jgi:hypothetical protein
VGASEEDSEAMTTPGRTATYDPETARAEVARVYGLNLRTGAEVRDYAAAMLSRFTLTCPSGAHDLAILGLFRHLVASLDAALRLLEAGASYMAALPTRAVVETSWSIEWALRSPEHRGRLLYVATLRLDQRGICRGIPGTPANLAYRRTVQAQYGYDPHPLYDGDPATLKAQYDELDRLLGADDYRDINRAFDAAQGSRDYDAPWYTIGPGAVGSYADMARELKREADYVMLYNGLSTTVHGSSVHRQLKADETGYWIEPIVGIAGFTIPFTLVTMLAVHAVRLLTEHYRSDEMPALRARFAAWSPGLDVPEVNLKPIFEKW